MSPMTTLQARNASGPAACSIPATTAGILKMPPPMVMLTMLAAIAAVPIARRRVGCAPPPGAGALRDKPPSAPLTSASVLVDAAEQAQQPVAEPGVEEEQVAQRQVVEG